MKIAIMQPYFFPYIGYFQLMNAVDEFVVYDNIKFTKKGWINRNRILVEGRDAYITLPLRADSDQLDVKERYLSGSWATERKKLLNRVREAYRKSPYFEPTFELVQGSLLFGDENLFAFIKHSLDLTKEYLDIATPLVISSSIAGTRDLKAEKRVIEICLARQATTYINPIGGLQLYSKQEFGELGIDLHFLRTREFKYEQFGAEFVPFLSIIDVMMFNSRAEIRQHLEHSFDLI